MHQCHAPPMHDPTCPSTKTQIRPQLTWGHQTTWYCCYSKTKWWPCTPGHSTDSLVKIYNKCRKFDLSDPFRAKFNFGNKFIFEKNCNSNSRLNENHLAQNQIGFCFKPKAKNSFFEDCKNAESISCCAFLLWKPLKKRTNNRFRLL